MKSVRQPANGILSCQHSASSCRLEPCITLVRPLSGQSMVPGAIHTVTRQKRLSCVTVHIGTLPTYLCTAYMSRILQQNKRRQSGLTKTVGKPVRQ